MREEPCHIKMTGYSRGTKNRAAGSQKKQKEGKGKNGKGNQKVGNKLL